MSVELVRGVGTRKHGFKVAMVVTVVMGQEQVFSCMVVKPTKEEFRGSRVEVAKGGGRRRRRRRRR